MCPLLRQCEESEGEESEGWHRSLAQQRRLVWGLVLWSSIMTLALAASFTFLFCPGMLPKDTGTVSREELSGGGDFATHQPSKATRNYLTLELKRQNSAQPVGNLLWKIDDVYHVDVKIPKDGWYFMYLQVTLQTSTERTNHTVRAIRNENTDLEGQIQAPHLSTGLMGKLIKLGEQETVRVTCSPPAQINTTKVVTYLGIVPL